MGLGTAVGFGRSSSSFLPTDLDNILLWLEFDQNNVFTTTGPDVEATDTDPVEAVDSLEGNSYRFSNTDTNKQPLYEATGINSLPWLHFDGSDDLLRHGTAILSGTTGTIFAVAKQDAVHRGAIISSADEGSTQSFQCSTENTTGYARFFVSGISDARGTTTSLGTTNARLIMWQQDAVTLAIRVDGIDQTIDNATDRWLDNATGKDNVVLGATKRSTEVTQFDGKVAAVIVYSDVLTSDEVSQVETYLADKYGISI